MKSRTEIDKEIDDMGRIISILKEHDLKARRRMLEFIWTSREYGIYSPLRPTPSLTPEEKSNL